MNIKLLKFLLFNAITIALFSFASCSSSSDDEVGNGNNGGNGIDGSAMVVKLSAAGTLASYITDDAMYKITRLKVSGEINGTDIWLLRKMAGYETDGVLAYLDLSDARIVAGGKPYLEDAGTSYSTKDDIMTEHMFELCLSLVSVCCPNSAKEIEYGVFGRCAGLISVELPSSLLEIYYPFYYCDNLKSIKCKTIVPPRCEQLVGTNNGFYKNVILYVPKGSKKTYKNTDYWGFQNIEEY